MFGKLSWSAIPFNQPIPLITSLVVMLIMLGVLVLITVRRWWPYLWREWITSVDHKRIGIMYCLLGVVMLIRGFAADVAITGATRLVLPALGRALQPLVDQSAVTARRARLADRREAMQAGWRKLRDEVKDMRPLSPVWVSACLAQARDPGSTIVNEYTLLPEHCPSTRPGSFFGSSPAAGLGWGAGAG